MPRLKPMTMDEVKRSPAEIAVAAAALADDARRETLRADVARWRELVAAIAEGAEPDGKALRDIADLTARLHLPVNSLAAHVALVTQEQRLAADVAKAQAEGKAAEERMEPLGREVQGTRERLVTLQAEADANILAQQLPVHLANRLDDLRRQTPILFDEITNLASIDGNTSPATWSVLT